MARPGHGKGACQLHGWAGELRTTVGYQRVHIVPTSMETSAIVGASLLRLQWMHWYLGFIMTRVSGESTATGGELSLCWL